MMANLSTNDFNLNGIEHHWNKLCQTNRDDLQEPSDFFMAITHCCFIQSGFLCLGVGEGVTPIPNEIGNFDLPTGWYGNRNEYNLRYQGPEHIYHLNGHVSGSYLDLSLWRSNKWAQSIKRINLNMVEERTGNTLLQIIPGIHNVLDCVGEILTETNIVGHSKPPSHSARSSPSTVSPVSNDTNETNSDDDDDTFFEQYKSLDRKAKRKVRALLRKQLKNDRNIQTKRLQQPLCIETLLKNALNLN